MGESATWDWDSLLKMVLLSIGLHQGVTIYYMYTKVPTKELLSVNGCQIIVVEGNIRKGNLLFCHFADFTLLFK